MNIKKIENARTSELVNFQSKTKLTNPICLSIWKILLLAPASYNFDVTSFSTPNTTPSLPLIATAVLKKMIYVQNDTISQISITCVISLYAVCKYN